MVEVLKKLIELEEWLKIYEKISKELNLSYQEDLRATEFLAVLIRNKGLDAKVLEPILSKKNVIIAGAGPSIVEDLESIKKIDRKKWFTSHAMVQLKHFKKLWKISQI
jgi:Uncharacterized Rossmann fold enzyme